MSGKAKEQSLDVTESDAKHSGRISNHTTNVQILYKDAVTEIMLWLPNDAPHL